MNNPIERFYQQIQDYSEEAPRTRYKSWEWCHKAFLNNKATKENDENYEKVVDLLALHLAFYLASWGMYRGSSFLLQRDYKTHKKAVREILNPHYSVLWDFTPSSQKIEDADQLLFRKDDGIYWKVKKSYLCEDKSESLNDEASDTLVTKILMGTYACIPAFDRFLKSGIQFFEENEAKKSNPQEIGEHQLTHPIENQDKLGTSAKSFKALAQLAKLNPEIFKISVSPDDFYYPPMKCVDMYFWEVGYEKAIADSLKNDKVSSDKKAKLTEKVIQLYSASSENQNFDNLNFDDPGFEQVSKQVETQIEKDFAIIKI